MMTVGVHRPSIVASWTQSLWCHYRWCNSWKSNSVLLEAAFPAAGHWLLDVLLLLSSGRSVLPVQSDLECVCIHTESVSFLSLDECVLSVCVCVCAPQEVWCIVLSAFWDRFKLSNLDLAADARSVSASRSQLSSYSRTFRQRNNNVWSLNWCNAVV